MLGAILGDVIGSPYEFDSNNIKTTDFPLFSPSSRFTDDTVMTVAVAQALTEKAGQEPEAIRAALVSAMQSLGRRYPDAGYGGRFFRWLWERSPRPYYSFGNGSAMRVSPVGWLYGDMEETLRMAALTAEVTHDHPEGIRGAQAVATAIFLARCGWEREDMAAYLTRRFFYDLRTPLAEIRPRYRMDVSCQGSVPQAIRAFLEGGSYEETVRLAVSIGGDSDTIACIAGGIAEAYFGIPAELEEAGLACLQAQEPAFVAAVSDFRAYCSAHAPRPEPPSFVREA